MASFDVSARMNGKKRMLSANSVRLIATTFWLLPLCFLENRSFADDQMHVLKINSAPDFELSGDGSSPQWETAEWVDLPQRKIFGEAFATRIKILYSTTGIYFLFDCEDRRLTATLREDFLDLWNEDVVEVFLWTDESFPAYFEYELSPLNYELPILVPNNKGDFWGWRPWHYAGERLTRHATSVRGGEKQSGAAIAGWRAEFFIPYALLKPLGNVPPRPGTRWRANFYRCDYDSGGMATWEWQAIDFRFHEYEKFGTLIFE
ncbi:MAG: hypothetical protein DKINENOH_00877 [bacterium]|nr:hypothetical protein [bacterium]